MMAEAYRRIEAQQEGAPAHTVMMGEQLKDICRAEPNAAELIAQDLENEELSLAKLSATFQAYADKHRQGNTAVIAPRDAEQLIRTFYGLAERAGTERAADMRAAENTAEDKATHMLPQTPAARTARAKPISFLDLLAKGE